MCNRDSLSMQRETERAGERKSVWVCVGVWVWMCVFTYSTIRALDSEAGNQGPSLWPWFHNLLYDLVWKFKVLKNTRDARVSSSAGSLVWSPRPRGKSSREHILLLKEGRGDSLHISNLSLYPSGFWSFLCSILVMGSVRKEKSILQLRSASKIFS